MSGKLDGKVAIVTGASRGLGRAIALRLARDGANVAVNDVDMEGLNRVVEEIKVLGKEAIGLRCDVSKIKDVQEVVDAAISKFGKIDILVNNAGINRDNLLFKLGEKDWDNVININLKGTYICTQLVTNWMVSQAKMEKEKGREIPARKVISVTSDAGMVGNPGQANYAASKAGMIGFTKTAAKELARFNILVNAIAPVAATPMTGAMTEAAREATLKQIPLGRMGDPERDIAPVVAFLASEDSNYITGQVIRCNGGYQM